ncbi:ABC transporter permease subunit [Escherichia coli]|nr:ABC transporter permease subunit [Escherichia coli]
MKKMMIATLAAASVLLAVANQAHAGATLDAVQKKGFVQCGISDGLPGFSYADADGKFSGIDVDVCRGVAAAVFGDDTKVKYTPLTAKERFTALQSGEVDLLSRNTTWTSSRDAGMVLIPELAALTLALSVYTSAFIAEIIRAGIQAVPYGQHEAARSLGLPNPVTLRQVIIPQALRVIIPPLTSQYLNIVKNSSLAAAIGYPDMVSLFAGTVLNQTGQAIETIAMTMSVYLIISLTISLLMNIYNRRIAIVER